MHVWRGFLRALLLLATAGPLAADEVRTEQVLFPPGATGTTIEGAVAGYDSVHYLVAADTGQEMTVALTADNPMASFNVFAPGDVPGESTALFIGARGGTEYRGLLAVAGDYTIQVFLIRAAARRGEGAEYELAVAVAAPAPATAPAAEESGDNAGEPALWRVAGLEEGDLLKLRAGPSTDDAILRELPEGTVLRNLGCRMSSRQRWCEVEQEGAAAKGWVARRYLMEAGPN